MTPKQENWYRNALAAFAQPGNRYSGVTSLTFCAACLGIAAEQVIADAHAHGITNRDSDIRRGMTTALAKVGSRPATGYIPRRCEERRQTFPGFVRDLIRDGGGEADFAALSRLSPIPVSGMSAQAQTAAFLAVLFAPTDYLFVFDNNRHERGEIGRNILTRAEWLERMRRTGDLGGDCVYKNAVTGRQGATGEGWPSYTSRDCIAAYHYALIEFDYLPIPKQCAFWRGWLSNPKRAAVLTAITFSGGKSIHGLVRTGADAVTAPTVERDLRDLLCADPEVRTITENGKEKKIYPYRTDYNTLKPHGGTRLAGATRHSNGATQTLLYLARQ